MAGTTITLPTKPKITLENKTSAVFEIENLYPGYGTTLGNALRRVLLSSLPGAAVTRMKIAGVDHEFTTVPGVLEDVVSIMLNIKQLRFKLHGLEPQLVTLKAQGEKQVLGKDLVAPSQVEVISQDALIATLTDKNAKLDMELTVEPGIGYVPAEIHKKGKLGIGTIAVDSIFTPVRLVSYSVENMRVGERTDFNRLRLRIETDGTISPQEAFNQAVKILIDQFSALLLAESQISPEAKVPTAKEKSINELPLSTRTKNALVVGGVKTIDDLLQKSRKDLAAFEGLGAKGLAEIQEVLLQLGLSLKE